MKNLVRVSPVGSGNVYPHMLKNGKREIQPVENGDNGDHRTAFPEVLHRVFTARQSPEGPNSLRLITKSPVCRNPSAENRCTETGNRGNDS